MPKLPRDLSGTDVGRALERLGWTKASQRGSHMKFVRGARAVSVPAHRIVKPGTLRAILRESSVPLEQFLEVL